MLAWLPHGAMDTGLLPSALPLFIEDGTCTASISAAHHHSHKGTAPTTPSVQKLSALWHPAPSGGSGASGAAGSPGSARLVELALLAMRGVASAYRDLQRFRHAK